MIYVYALIVLNSVLFVNNLMNLLTEGAKDVSEEMLVEGVKQNSKHIKMALIDRGMTQVELAKLLNANPQVLNKAIQGDMSPRSLELRKRINQVLGL